MNYKQVERAVSPFLIVVSFVAVSLVVSNIYEVRTTTNILALGVIELYAFYLFTAFSMDRSKRRSLCTVLVLSMSISTAPYSVVTYLYEYTNNNIINQLHDFAYNSYGSFSYVIFVLLIIISVMPGKMTNGLCSRFGVNTVVVYIGRRFKVSFLCAKKDQ